MNFGGNWDLNQLMKECPYAVHTNHTNQCINAWIYATAWSNATNLEAPQSRKENTIMPESPVWKSATSSANPPINSTKLKLQYRLEPWRATASVQAGGYRTSQLPFHPDGCLPTTGQYCFPPNITTASWSCLPRLDYLNCPCSNSMSHIECTSNELQS